MIDLKLPFPPSNNTYYRARVLPPSAGIIGLVAKETRINQLLVQRVLKAAAKYLTAKNQRSKRGREYRDQVIAAVLEQIGRPKPTLERVSMTLEISPPDRRKRDILNYDKALPDALEAIGIFKDDEQIDMAGIYRRPISKGGHVLAHIEEIPSK